MSSMAVRVAWTSFREKMHCLGGITIGGAEIYFGGVNTRRIAPIVVLQL